MEKWDDKYGFKNNADVRLESNVFCDISAQAYGAVAYFMFLKYIWLFFIQMKYIPSEIKYSITIPKLQLQLAVLKCTIWEEIDFNIHKIRFETDSKISLSYIWNLSVRFLVYIMNRLH